jgi:hypothetical protein
MGKTPEEEEMEIKRKVLGKLEETLADKKLELREGRMISRLSFERQRREIERQFAL